MNKWLEISTYICDIAKAAGEKGILEKAVFLRQRIKENNGYLLFLGESCSGKSLLINSLIGEPLLPVEGVPSTAVITEVYLNDEISEPQYALIKRNATRQLLSLKEFQALAKRSDPEINRLRAILPDNGRDLPGVSFFDTPGYGSLIQEHDEVLMEFLPNCDAAVYIVNYKVGLQEVDSLFLKEMIELTFPETQLYLVINRCPKGLGNNDRRVSEVYRAASAILDRPELPLILVPSVSNDNGVIASEEIDRFRDRLRKDIHKPERIKAIEDTQKLFLRELTEMFLLRLQQRQVQLNSNAEEKRELRELANGKADEVLIAIDRIVKPGFKKIKDQMAKRIDEICHRIEDTVCSEIDKQSMATKSETTAFVTEHLLPFNSEKGALDIQHFLTIELEEINCEVNEYLNQIIANYEHDIQLKFAASNAVKAGAGIIKRMMETALNDALIAFFAKYGGKGGIKAGMPNLASHWLKTIGKLFGKKFSLETHNALKHIMKVLRLNTTRALGASIAVAMDTILEIVDAATWRPFLKNTVRDGMKDWKKDTFKQYTEELDKLEKENIKTLQEISDLIRNTWTDQENNETTLQDIDRLILEVENIKKELL